jgi:hypothetical protein
MSLGTTKLLVNARLSSSDVLLSRLFVRSFSGNEVDTCQSNIARGAPCPCYLADASTARRRRIQPGLALVDFFPLRLSSFTSIDALDLILPEGTQWNSITPSKDEILNRIVKGLTVLDKEKLGRRGCCRFETEIAKCSKGRLPQRLPSES